MEEHADHCPTCRRAFRSFRDYPRIQVLSFERLPMPEAVDDMSAAAAEKWLVRRRQQPSDPSAFRREGINMTPAIAEACEKPEVQDYLTRLAEFTGQKVTPDELLPPLRAHGYFQWAYPIEGTRLYLAVTEGELPSETQRLAEVTMHCAGPNLGSAGGPTMKPLGAIAQIRYQGLLADQASIMDPYPDLR